MTPEQIAKTLTDKQLRDKLKEYIVYRRELGRRNKSKNAYASLAKAKANGTKMGRKKLRDDKEIKRLRKLGLSIRQIAKEIGLSTGSVQRGLE